MPKASILSLNIFGEVVQVPLILLKTVEVFLKI